MGVGGSRPSCGEAIAKMGNTGSLEEDVELHLVHIDNDISVALKLNMPRPRGRVVWKQDDTL